jgi:hypothetical protein
MGAGVVLRLLRGFNQEQATLRLAVRGVSPAALEALRIEERTWPTRAHVPRSCRPWCRFSC